MKHQSFGDLVDFFAVPAEPGANEVEIVRANRCNCSAIIGVIVGRKQFPTIDRRLEARAQ